MVAIYTTHNIKRINSGALDLVFDNFDGISIENDVYVGENVTIMPNVIVRNGAVIARNSHVVSDVPPYAIVGGNPAKVIGYRFMKDQINQLQHIQWWYWSKQELIDHAEYLLSEDIERICEKFYPEANDLVMEDKKRHNLNKNNTDSYFVFVDYYENYDNYSEIIEVFIEKFGNNKEKELVLFVQEFDEIQIEAGLYEKIKEIVKNVNEEVSCTIKLCKGTKEAAKEVFLDCKHYIISRTYDAVYFSCLADLLGMDIIFGTDTNIAFEKTRNMYKV